jgi:hypothetical protein
LQKRLSWRRVVAGAPEVRDYSLLVTNLLITVCYVLGGQDLLFQ